jgi:hypothetical protein
MKDRKNLGRGLAKVSHLFLSGPEPPKEKVTIQVAAGTLGVSKGTIITYLNKGLLSRIKEDGRIYVSMDEVRTLGDTKRKPQVKPAVTTSAKRNKRVSVNKERDRPKRPLASFGLLESERQYLLTCKAALEAKDKELETLTIEVNALKRNVKTQANELKGTESRLRKLEKERQKLLGEFKKTTDANNQEKERTQARLLAVDDKGKRLRRPWWQELFGHLRLQPEGSRKKGVVLFTTLSLLAVLVFSGWWFSRSQKQPPSPVAEVQPSRSGAVQTPSQPVSDSELEQEQSARVVQQPSEPLNTTVAPEPEPAALNGQTAQPYTSSVEGSPSAGKRVSFWSEEDQHVVGLSSTASPYFLRAETLAATWLQVVIDGRQELEYLLQPNEKHTWKAMSGFRLHIGNAAGLQLYLNDQPLKPLGESGEVVHLQLPDPSLIVTTKSEYTEPVSGP